MTKLDKIRDYCALFFWSLSIFSYFFQFPFSNLSKLIIPCLSLFILLQIPNFRILKDKKYLYIVIIYISYLMFSFVYSINNCIELTRIMRFLLILSVIPVCTLIFVKNFDKYKKIFIIISVLKALVLIAIALYLIVKGDHTLIRHWAFSNNYGDIYLLSSIPKVQVKGNALLVIAFFISVFDKKKINWISAILLLGVLCAGNFAFIIALLLFALYLVWCYFNQFSRQKRINWKKILPVFSILLIIFVPYFVYKIQEKASYSNAIRKDQIIVLTDTNFLIGNGLGNEIVITTDYREYNGDMYFELQTLYIYNQIGILGIFLFYFVTIYPLLFLNKHIVFLYFIFLIFTFWNPYCFDTTQMISTILLINTFNTGEINDQSNYYSLSSFTRKPPKYKKYK